MMYSDGMFFGFHFLAWLFWIALIGLVVWLVVRPATSAAPRPRTPREILDERYARGEIDSAEYDERRRRFESGSPQP